MTHADTPAAIGPRLYTARVQAGLELPDVARQMLMSPDVLRRLEAGRYAPTEEQAMALARIYGVSSAWLLHGREKPALEPTPVIPLFGPRSPER